MLKHFLQVLLFLWCVGCPFNLHAKVLTPEEAAKTATEFFSAGNTSRLGNSDALELAHTAKKSDGTPVYYVFNAKNGRGFIIISADDKAVPVVGYSYESSFVPEKVSDVTATMLDNAVKPVADSSFGLRQRVVTRVSSGKVLSTPEWSQESPFNSQIPNYRLVGCVGTALATVMKYHNYPAAGHGSLDGTDFNTQYDWKHMRMDNYRRGYTAEEADAVATLMAHCAISIKTDFGMSGSSAFEVRVPAALISFFGYDSGVSYKKRSETDREMWDAIIVDEIEAGRPVIYSGQDVSAGHAFVCDGYEMRGSVPYFHINWGWGGAANGYFSSDALNPTVSTSHSFNDQTTIIYNIKPAATSTNWSPVHLTADEYQIGMTSDVTDIEAGTKFSVRAGALKNVSYETFSGKIAVALFAADGRMKALLNEGKGLTLQSIQLMSRLYADFDCVVPAGTEVAADDVIRMVTQSNGSSEWLPVTGDLITANEVKAKNYTIPYWAIDIPTSVDGAVVSDAASRVIKGRDYAFKVVPASADKVVTVKVNGFILSPDANHIYKVNNVASDQQIRIIVQSADEVVAKRNLWVTAGGLANLVGEADAGTIKELTLYGTIDARDFTFIRERMKVTLLDISGVNIVANGSNPANAIPTKAFSGYGSLQGIKLPKSLTTLKNGCFNATGLRSIEIPASVGTYEYNIFLNCSNLSEVIVRRQSPAWVNWCVFVGTPLSKLVVPVGAKAAYEAKENWQDFKEIVEENATPETAYTVVLEEMEGVKITPETEQLTVAPGSAFSFTVEIDNRFGDARMEVFANTTKLNAGTDGRYTVTIHANTMIHADFVYPQPTSYDSSWKLTDSRGGVGLATDVINVIAGKAFSIRANALAIPQDDASMFYAAVLTDANGAIKEFISPVFTNSGTNYGDLPCTFNCQVKESTVREGNLVRIATSYNKKTWHLVKGINGNVKDSIRAIGNEVVYHRVNMPSTIQGATIQGAVSEIVHGMDFSCKVMPVSVADAITVQVNGKLVADRVGVAQVKVESVREDLDISIQVVAAGDETYTALNIHAGELASKVTESAFPSRLKLMGEMNAADFKVLQDNASKLVALDLADVTIKSYPNPNALPSNAFAASNPTQATALTTIILPKNLESIEENAFYRCANVQEITIPATVIYIGNGAFAACIKLTKIVALSKTPVQLKNNPFPTNTEGITLEVPQGAEEAYASSEYWKDLASKTSEVFFNIQIDQSRCFQYTQRDILTHIPHPGNSTKTVMLGLPNFIPTSNKPNPVYRKGVAFKLYDNEQDKTSLIDPLDPSNVFYPGGYYLVKFYGTASPESFNYPQDHVIDIVFHYGIKFNDASGKAKIEFKNLDGANVWSNADMSLFVEGSSERKTLYKEGCDYQFTVTSENASLAPVVKMGGEEMHADENGVYTIANLQSDVTVDVTMALVEGTDVVVGSEEVTEIDKEAAAAVEELGLSGEVSDETFAYIRENFTSLETLDLSATENSEIPAAAFAGMESLVTVVIPENVTAIGEGAFENCTNLQALSLKSVNTIGAGAFEGCTSLTSITLYGNLQGGATRATAAGGITDDSFKGINPNCIIYVAKGLEGGLSSKSNVVFNGDGKCEALTDIVLDDASAFNIPASFNLGERNISLSLTLDYPVKDAGKSWRGIVLPFVPTRIFDEKGNDFTVGSSALHTVSMFSFNENAPALESQAAIEVNKPYLMRLNEEVVGTVDLTFTASSTQAATKADGTLAFDVPITPEVETIVKAGKEFTLHGNYVPQKVVPGMYVVDEEGYSFECVDGDEENGRTIAPFSVYATANTPEAEKSFKIGEIIFTGIEDGVQLEGDKLQVYKDGANLVMVSAVERDVRIFTVSGICIATVTVKPGMNTISLTPGVYIVDGIKVIL